MCILKRQTDVDIIQIQVIRWIWIRMVESTIQSDMDKDLDLDSLFKKGNGKWIV